MPFNLLEAIADMEAGVAYSAHFNIIITPPSATPTTPSEIFVNDEMGPEVLGLITFRADQVIWPGRQAVTMDYRTYGPIQRVAYDSAYDKVQMSLTLTPGFDAKKFFERWQDLAVGYARGTLEYPPGIFDLGYYNEYIGSVLIRQYDPCGALRYQCQLMEAFPVTVGGVNADWGDTQLSRLGLEWSYRYFVDDPNFFADSPRAQMQQEIFVQNSS